MKVWLQVLGAADVVVASTAFDGFTVTMGSGEDDDLFLDGLHPGAVEIRNDGGQVTIRSGRLPWQPVADGSILSFGPHRVRIRLVRDMHDVAAVRGACPRCGGPLSDQQIGGAYRSMARSERGCSRCLVTVLELSAAASRIGTFSERSKSEWVAVTVPMACPGCLSAMTRCAFRTQRGEAEVERCHACELVVFDAADRAHLTDEG